MAPTIPRLLRMLRAEYGESNWWPGESTFEIMAGAILTQNTAWANVEKAVANLKRSGLMSPKAIARASIARLESAIRPSGFYRQKARYLIAFSKYIVEKYGGSFELMRARPVDRLRIELLGIPGIGPETADSILLYALGKPSFVVDAYTNRLLARLEMTTSKGCDATKRLFESSLRRNVKDYSEMHALIVTHCKTRCRKTPVCDTCPLGDECPSERKD